MRFHSRTLRGLGVSLAVALAAPVPAGAVELPHSGGLTSDTVAAGPDGHLAAVAGEQPIAIRFAEPGATAFARTFTLGAGGFSPTVAAGPGGALAVLWSSGGPDAAYLVAYRAPGAAAFGPPEPLTIDPPGGEQWPAAAFDGAGTLTVAWASDDHDDQMLVRTRTAAGAWSPPQVLRARRAFRPRLAVTPNGSAVLAWSDDEDDVAVASRAPGAGTFGAPLVVSRRPGSSEPAVAANDRGDAAVAWDQDAKGDGAFTVVGAFRAAGATAFGAPRRISRPGTQGAFPSASVAPDGRAVFAYGSEPVGGPARVEGRIRTRSGRLMPSVVLDRSAQGGDAEALAAGRGVVAWFHRDRPRHRSWLQTASARADGASFAPAVSRYRVTGFGGFGVEANVFAVPGGLLIPGPGTRLTRSAG